MSEFYKSITTMSLLKRNGERKSRVNFSIVNTTTRAVEDVTQKQFLASTLPYKSNQFLEGAITLFLIESENQFSKRIDYNKWCREETRTSFDKLKWWLKASDIKINKRGIIC